jgi:hypothetical protein
MINFIRRMAEMQKRKAIKRGKYKEKKRRSKELAGRK